MFTQQPLRKQKTIGELLRSARVESGRSIEEYGQRLKIAAHYLESLELGRYNTLPSPVYIKNYLRLYAEALGIPWKKIEERYQQEITVYHKMVQPSFAEKNTILAKKKPKHAQHRRGIHIPSTGGHDAIPLLIPRLLKVGLFGIVVLLLVIYFGWGVIHLVSPPELVVTNPESDIIVNDHSLVVTGRSAPEVVVQINGQTVGLTPEGQFSEEVVLREGLNTIQVTAKSKLSQQLVVVRHVLYTNQENN